MRDCLYSEDVGAWDEGSGRCLRENKRCCLNRSNAVWHHAGEIILWNYLILTKK